MKCRTRIRSCVPADDIEVINTELALADLDTLKKSMNVIVGSRLRNEARSMMAVLEKVRVALEEGDPVRSIDLVMTKNSCFANFIL